MKKPTYRKDARYKEYGRATDLKPGPQVHPKGPQPTAGSRPSLPTLPDPTMDPGREQPKTPFYSMSSKQDVKPR